MRIRKSLRPGGETKLRALVLRDYAYWRAAVRRATESGEINPDTDLEESVALFHQVYRGLSYEMRFFEGLDTDLLERRLNHIYALLKRYGAAGWDAGRICFLARGIDK